MSDFKATELNPDLADVLSSIASRIPEDFLLQPMLAEAELLRGDIVRSIYDSADKPKGDLARSFQVELMDKGDESVSVGVYSELVYAKIQDEGGRIEPKKKWLAFPHKDAKSYVGE